MSWKEDFTRHAKLEYPKECCGLAVNKDGETIYIPCRNTAKKPERDFVIHPSDQATCEGIGEIVGICHSHPDATANPSNSDLAKAQALNEEYPRAEWFIFSWPQGDLYSFMPSSERAKLLGRPFVFGTWDCYGLIRDYFHSELNTEIPDYHREDGFWKEGKELYLDNFESAGFNQVCENSPEALAKFEFKVGDVIIMQIRSTVANHAAVYIGNGMILQHMYGKLSKRDIYGGFWMRCTRAVVRHSNFL